MNDDSRPNPDALLSALSQAEVKKNRGKLKIFLGMCAGVGKTFAMLQDARQRRAEGLDVVAAVVETHRRAETEALCKDLPFIPLRRVEYRGVTLTEMDLDAVLARRPQVVLVDELAHTNAPESRHPKRYQDVLELLEAGINVYTTLNIQHVDSRVDAVSRITGIHVTETVPDSVIDRADEIQLIDLTSEKLRERLSEGKVYLGEKAATAANNFFREENLTALREISLRLTAERVGQTLRDVMESKQIGGPWKTNERPMVAVGPSPFSEKLIRWTRRVAAALDTSWVAVYVETPRPLTEDEKARLSKNLSLARQLGAEIVLTSGVDVAGALLRAAREHNVTQIIIGKTLGQAWQNFFSGGSLVDQLIQRSGDIDIYVVRAEKSPATPRARTDASTVKTWLQELMLGTAAVSGVTLACWLAQNLIGYWAVALIYLSLVVFLATRFHRLTILWTTTACALLWDFLFIPPRFTFRVEKLHDLLMLLLFYIIALVMGQLTYKLRLQEQAERKHDQRTQALFRIAQSAVESTTLDEGLKRTLQEIETLFQAQTVVMLVNDGGELEQQFPTPLWTLSEKETSVASWAFLNNRSAGRLTDSLPDSKNFYLPLHTSKSKFGVLVLHVPDRKSFALEERELAEAIADQAAVMVERFRLIQQANRAQLAEESERLYKVILDSVSHELKTPLAVITAAAENLKQHHVPGKDAEFLLTEEIQSAVVRLRRAIENLLGMSRIESGRLKLELNWCEVAELLQAAREQAADVLSHHKVRGALSPELPLVKLDFGLMVHAFSNLLTNAALYSPEDSEIRLSAHMDNQTLIVRIADEGPGLPAGDPNQVFEKFYRGPNAKPGGSGLGLAIVKALVEAHGGMITAENNPGHGATFIVRLPVTVTPLDAETPLP
jgi:two-component system sensor histidine kinase KdpD